MHVPQKYVCEDGYKLGKAMNSIKTGNAKLTEAQKDILYALDTHWDKKRDTKGRIIEEGAEKITTKKKIAQKAKISTETKPQKEQEEKSKARKKRKITQGMEPNQETKEIF